jgi:hypothetical protein
LCRLVFRRICLQNDDIDGARSTHRNDDTLKLEEVAQLLVEVLLGHVVQQGGRVSVRLTEMNDFKSIYTVRHISKKPYGTIHKLWYNKFMQYGTNSL